MSIPRKHLSLATVSASGGFAATAFISLLTEQSWVSRAVRAARLIVEGQLRSGLIEALRPTH